MPKYIMVYKNKKANDLSVLPKKQLARIMDLWGEWLGSMGSAVIDKGAAFKLGGKSITTDGITEADNLVGGYSVIEAKDFDEAMGLAQNNPMVMSQEGTIEIYEAFGD